MESNKNYGKNRRSEAFKSKDTRSARAKNSYPQREKKRVPQTQQDTDNKRKDSFKSFFTEKLGFLKKSSQRTDTRNTRKKGGWDADEQDFAYARENRNAYREDHYGKNDKYAKREGYKRRKKQDDHHREYSPSRNRQHENDNFAGQTHKKGHYDKSMGKTPGQRSDILEEIINHRRREGRESARKPKILSLEWNEERGPIRLNKYISNSGICSRREADDLIVAGAIKVNGVVVTELGTKVMPTDEVRYEDKILQREKPVYLLLNKPKDFITTTEDERDRNSVMSLIEGVCKERIYPVGRLDRNTTGLLLFTNDGEMTKKLTHPKFEIKKIYQVELDKDMTLADFETLRNGIELYDGFIQPDELEFVDNQRNVLGITLHSGKNRIVRRMFGHLGYEVEKLDRVYYAGLTKKDLPRGQYRFLTKAEINMLKMSL